MKEKGYILSNNSVNIPQHQCGLYRDIQLIPTLYFLKTAKYQIFLREN